MIELDYSADAALEANGATAVSQVAMGSFGTVVLHLDGTVQGWGVTGSSKGAGYAIFSNLQISCFFNNPTMNRPIVAPSASWIHENSGIAAISQGGITFCIRYISSTIFCTQAVGAGFNGPNFSPTESKLIRQIAVGSRGWTCTLSDVQSQYSYFDLGVVQCYNGNGPTDDSYRFKSLKMWDAAVACGQLLDGRIHWYISRLHSLSLSLSLSLSSLTSSLLCRPSHIVDMFAHNYSWSGLEYSQYDQSLTFLLILPSSYNVIRSTLLFFWGGGLCR
jgi:hypothetical protein